PPSSTPFPYTTLFRSRPVPLRHPGMVSFHTPGNVVVLSSGQQNWQMRHGAEKYAKLVYSSRYGFSVEADERAYPLGAFDGALALDRKSTRLNSSHVKI